MYRPLKPSVLITFDAASTGPLYAGFVGDCVWSKTLTVSNGWPTRVTTTPPHVPAKMSLAERTRADCGSAPDAAAKAPDDAGCAKPVAEMARPLLPCVGMVMLGESRTERKLRRMERARSATGGDGRGIVRIDGGTWRMASVAPTAGGRRDNKTR